MKRTTRPVSYILAAIAVLGLAMPPTAAWASTRGKKNTAIVLGAAAAQQLLSGKTTNGILLGAGAAYAYKRYKDAQRDEDRQRRVSEYRSSHAYRTSSGRVYRTSSGRVYRTSSVHRARSASRTRTPYRVASSHSTAYSTARRSRYGGTSVRRSSRVVFSGPIRKDTDFTSRRLLVTVNGAQRRIDVPKDTPIYQAGQRVSVHDLRTGDVVRVSAVRTASDRWRAQRIDVVHSYGVGDAGYDRSRDYARYGDDRSPDAYYPDDRSRIDVYRTDRSSDNGTYDDRGEGRIRSSSTYTGVGLVERVDPDEGTFDVRVGHNVRTVYATGARFRGLDGVDELRRGDRVRVAGDLDGRDVDAAEVSRID